MVHEGGAVILDPACVHESGHAVIASVCGRTLGAMAVRAGSGRTWHIPPKVPADVVLAIDVEQPFVLWPAQVKERFETDLMITAAGQAAEDYFFRRLGRVPASVSEQAAVALAELPEPGAIDRYTIAEALADIAPEDTDESRIWQIARACHGSDLTSLVTWIAHLEAQTAHLVALHEDAIARLAFVLDEAQTLSAEQVAVVAGGAA